MTPRMVDLCVFRSGVARLADEEFAECGLIGQVLGPEIAPALVPRAACEACCRSAPPAPDRLNDVIASFVYNLAGRRSREPLSSDRERAEAQALQKRAEAALKRVWIEPNHARWAGRVDNLPPSAELVDPSVNADTLAAHLRNAEPFTYLRYGDGEWFSILGAPGKNCDGHDFFGETMGHELRGTLNYVASLWPENQRLYTGLHTGLAQDGIRRHLREENLAQRVHWVKDNQFALGLRDLSTRRFLDAVRGLGGLKLLVGNESLAPVAKGLGCRHVVIPRTNCYLTLAQTENDCRFEGQGLVLCCAGMASECLLCRLHKANPAGTYVDCGSVFDALVGHPSRQYTRTDAGGILSVIRDHYSTFLGPG